MHSYHKLLEFVKGKNKGFWESDPKVKENFVPVI